MRALIFILVLVGLPVPAAVAAQLYVAPLDRAEWTSHSSEVGCHLVHEIPLFGFAILTHRGPAESFLSIFSDNPPLESQSAVLFSRSPTHFRQAYHRDLQHVRVQSDRETFHLSHRTTQHVLSELYEGRLVGLRLEAWWRDGQAEVALSNVGFRGALREHHACLAEMNETDPAVLHAEREDLLAMGYTAVAFERSEREPLPLPGPYEVFFSPHDSELDDATRDQLRELTSFLQHADAQWQQVDIAAYSDTDDDMDYNRMLAQHRVESIVEYLIAQGIDRERLEHEVLLASNASGLDDNGQVDPRQQRVMVVVRR